MIRKALLTALMTATLVVPAAAQVNLRVSMASIESDWLTKALFQFRDQVEASTGGAVKVQVFPNGTLFRQGSEVPAMQRGNLDMSTMTTVEIEQQIPEYSIFGQGYLFRDYDHVRKVFTGPIGEQVYAKVAEKMDLQILAPMYLGTRQLNLRTARDVKTPADLSGVKLRVPGGPGWLLLGRGLGAQPAPLAMPEVYLSLKTGAIDGQDNPLSLTQANKLYEVTQSIVMTSHLVQPVFLTIAVPSWKKLSPDQQAKVKEAALAAASYNDTNRIKDEAGILDFFKAQGLKIVTPDLAPFRANMKQVFAASDMAKTWQPGFQEQIEAVK